MHKDMMQKVWNLLAVCLGEPPEHFEVRLRDKDNNLVLAGTFTPQEFFAQAVDMNLDDYVSLISAPTADKPFNHTYTVSCLGNVVEAGQVRYLNLELLNSNVSPSRSLKMVYLYGLAATLCRAICATKASWIPQRWM